MATLAAVANPNAELVWVEGNDDDEGWSPATARLVSTSAPGRCRRTSAEMPWARPDATPTAVQPQSATPQLRRPVKHKIGVAASMV
jgi:hypothetical protein